MFHTDAFAYQDLVFNYYIRFANFVCFIKKVINEENKDELQKKKTKKPCLQQKKQKLR